MVSMFVYRRVCTPWILRQPAQHHLKQKYLSNSSSNKGSSSGDTMSLGVTAAGVFCCLAILQGKRRFEEHTGNDYGIIAVFEGRWGKKRVTFDRDRNSTRNDDD